MDDKYTEGYTGENKETQETKETGGQTEQQQNILESAGQQAGQEAGAPGQMNYTETESASGAPAGRSGPERHALPCDYLHHVCGGDEKLLRRHPGV